MRTCRSIYSIHGNIHVKYMLGFGQEIYFGSFLPLNSKKLIHFTGYVHSQKASRWCYFMHGFGQTGMIFWHFYQSFWIEIFQYNIQVNYLLGSDRRSFGRVMALGRGICVPPPPLLLSYNWRIFWKREEGQCKSIISLKWLYSVTGCPLRTVGSSNFQVYLWI